MSDEPASPAQMSLESPHYGSLQNSRAALTPEAGQQWAASPRSAYVAMAVLCYVNLVNYIERYTIAGVLPNIQAYFALSDGTAALLQTVFICSFLLLAPVFGYLGDRYNRKYIMIAGLIMWTLTSFCCSFVTESYFWALMLLRALVGIGEASYTTVAPTLIADLFTGARRSLMICAFYILIPVGSGLGFIIGAGVASQTGDWHWAFRINPIFGLVGIALLFFFCPNPPRGAAETQGEGVQQQSSYLEDVKYLLKIKSYVWSTLGITASTFNLGALAFWMPTFLSRARVFQGLHCQDGSCLSTDSYGFGVVTIVTGVLGGSIGTLLSRSFRDRLPHVDPLICAVGLLASVPCLIASIFTASTSVATAYVFAFLGQALVAMNWAVMADILLYIVIPNRRSTAEALQVMFIHLLGDCGSPYIVGAISDAIYRSNPETSAWSFHSLQYSITICPAVGFIGGLFYLVAVFYINDDRKAVLQFLEAVHPSPPMDPTVEPSVDQSIQKT
ncbi:hypothetical protein fugu_008751 [Takifugu bimaculatus]|uniref:Major facilitator superfamily (MFS) profile domain-containing protein n=1 Tax=Takifugu bimaculatus TaxID=433685 RepID=A0A4Z2AWM6_9TELE|nr:hypothetical protein fugu_008751 [Takifugu bimaculatus]